MTTSEDWKAQLAPVTILHGDCRELVRQLPDGVIDLTVFDPPYGKEYQSNRRATKSRAIAGDNVDAVLDLLMSVEWELHRAMRGNSHLYMFCDLMFMLRNSVTGILPAFDLTNVLIWAKGRGTGDTTGGQYVAAYESILFLTKGNRKLKGHPCDLIDAGRPSKHDTLHPTQKPIYALSKLIETSSKPGDVVLDLTAGSGSTGAACRVCEPGRERKVILMDIDAENVQTMRARLKYHGPIADRLPEPP